MMQVNLFSGLKLEITLFTMIFLCLKHLQFQPRVCLSTNRAFCSFSPIYPQHRVIGTVAPTNFDIASNRGVGWFQQGCCLCPESPLAISTEVVLSNPFARLVRVSPFSPLPQHLPLAVSYVVIGVFSSTVTVVVSPSPNNRVESLDGVFCFGLFMGIQDFLDLAQVSLNLFFLRAGQEDMFEVSNRKAEEVKTFLSMNNMSFSFTQFQPSFRQELVQAGNDIFLQDLTRWGYPHKVVGKPYQANAFIFTLPFCWWGEPTFWSFTTKQSFHSVQRNVSQQRTDDAALGRSRFRVRIVSEFDHARLEPTADDVVEDGYLCQQGIVGDVIKAAANVRIQYPFTATSLVKGRVNLSNCVHTASSWPESVRVGLEAGFPFRFKRCFHDGLHHSVFYGRDAQGSLFTIGFWNVDSFDWLWAVALERHSLSAESRACFGRVVHPPIHTRCVLAPVFLRYSPDCQELVRRGSRQEFLKTSDLWPLLALSGAVNSLLESPDVSIHLLPVNLVPGGRLALIGLFNEYLHCLTSPIIKAFPKLPYRQNLAEVCTLSGWVFPALSQALSTLLPSGLRFFRFLLPATPSPSLTVGLPSDDGVYRVYPVDDRGDADQRGWSLSPGGATDVAVRSINAQPVHLPFWLQRVSLLSLFKLNEVYRLFTFVQPSGLSLALDHLRLVVFGTLSLRLRTAVFTFARSDRDTWTSQGLCYGFISQHSSAALIWTTICTYRFHTGRKTLKLLGFTG
jgi:hypothetical protein